MGEQTKQPNHEANVVWSCGRIKGSCYSKASLQKRPPPLLESRQGPYVTSESEARRD
jgi:hypothetical protein